nr:glutathione S-transferase family protein [uncultured Cohaesibacter sp.]
MMILRSSSTSPFVRKVMIAAKLLGLFEAIHLQDVNLQNPSEDLPLQNPLGKIPALILETGEVIFDSAVIVDALDLMAGGNRLIPTDPEPRRRALTLQALCDGVLEASVLLVAEQRFRSEDMRSEQWMTLQAGKVARALAHLEAMVPGFDQSLDVGKITLACALAYRDLRFPSEDWRSAHPNLAQWLVEFDKTVPAFAETAFKA